MEMKRIAAAVVGMAGRRRPLTGYPFGFRLAASRLRPSRNPPAALTAYLVKTPTAVVIVQAPEGAVKRWKEAPSPKIVRIFLDRLLCVA
jgi:hypothetical protein